MNENEQPYFIQIEDDEDDRFIFREALNESGCSYPLIQLTNATAFFAYLRDNSREGSNLPVLVILNIKLPGMNGFEVLRIMRQNSLWRHIPVFILTGNRSSYLMEKARALGAREYLVKPSSIMELAQQVKQSLEPCLDSDSSALH